MTILVEIKDLTKWFPVKSARFHARETQFVHAVDDLTLSIDKARNTAFVGESGCGKSTTGRMLLRLVWPTKGSVHFMGRSIFGLSEREMKLLRPQMQMIFQNPFSSLNPRKTARDILEAPFKLHEQLTREELRDAVFTLLNRVGLSPPELYVDRYPHQFSGGQKQRLVIARAIALKPRFIVADEPVSSLDLSVRAQILNLMKELQQELEVTYLFITHDLAVVRSLCDTVVVMYLGKIVEQARTRELFENPLHPYTQLLLASTPIPDPEKNQVSRSIESIGDVPSPIHPPSGCRFNTRCPFVMDQCRRLEPPLRGVADGHLVACHLVNPM